MMKRSIKTLCLTGLMVASTLTSFSQQAGMTIVGLSGQNMSVTGSTLYVPAGGYLNNTGNNYIAVDKIVAGNAGTTITGTAGSRLHLLAANQADPAAPAQTTMADGNDVVFDVDITSYNPSNLSLADQTFGTTVTDGAANFSVGRQFAFGVTNPFTGAAITDNHVINNSNRFIVGAGGTLAGYDETRYVITNDNLAELRKLGLTTGQSFFFPIGRAEADYTPANMQVAGGGPVDYYMNVRNFAESVPDENIGGYAMMPNVSRTWQVYASIAGSTANIDFIHPGTPMYEVNGYDRTNSNVIRFSMNSWIPNLPSDAENESLFGTPPNYFAQQINFMIPAMPGDNAYYGKSNSVNIVPVKLGSFNVGAAGCDAKIAFSTYSETDLASIRIERSYTALQGFWEIIRTFPSDGNSNSVKQYSYTDVKPAAAVAYYRLVFADTDGRVTYSSVRSAGFNCGGGLVVYPNPAQDFVNVVLPPNADTYRLRLVNNVGQIIHQISDGSGGTIRINISMLAKGTYYIVYTGRNNKIMSVPIVKY